MPRKHPLPAREAAICMRVADVRKETGLSRRAFALKAGIDDAELKRIEYFRVPLRFSIADAIAKRFQISQRWIATGKGEKHGYVAVHPEATETIPARSLFSGAFDTFLSK